jgi:hypothetical protein
MPFDSQGNWVDAPTDPFGGGGGSGGTDWGSIFGPGIGGDVNTGVGSSQNPLTMPSGWGQIGQGFSDIWSSLTSGGSGSPLGMGLSATPGLMALNYAGQQPGFDPTNLQSILGQLGGNQDAVVRAATDPFQKNIAAGYGDLVKSQGARGIRGSSFGDTDISNYMDITGRGLANAGASAAQGSLALQGDLASRIAQFQQQQQFMKNNMYGRAFDVLGRGLNPQGYGSNINIGGQPSGGGGGGGGGGLFGGIGNLAGGIGSLFGF